MCRSRAACDSEPVWPMRSSSAILPGPTACLRPMSTRKRMAGIGMRCRQVGRGAWVALVAAVLPRYIQMNITIGAARTSSVRTVIQEHSKMRKQILTTAAILISCAAATGREAVDIGANTKGGGQIFFDVSHISLQNENSSGAKIDAAPTGTGFDVKRFYLSIDHRFNDVWSADLTTDAQFSTASTATVTTSTGNTTVLTNQNSSGGVSEVFIKKLYLEGKFDRAFVVHIGSYDMPWDPVGDKADGFSGWASYAFDAQWSVFGRYDEAKLSKDVAPNLKDKYLNIGLAYKPIKALDFALVYKNEKVNNGSTSVSGADANGSYAIGGANGTRNGTFDELGLYAQW